MSGDLNFSIFEQTSSDQKKEEKLVGAGAPFVVIQTLFVAYGSRVSRKNVRTPLNKPATERPFKIIKHLRVT